MKKLISHNDKSFRWTGLISLEMKASVARPWRIPFEEKHLYHEKLANWAEMPAGVTISFESNTPWFEVLCQYSFASIQWEGYLGEIREYGSCGELEGCQQTFTAMTSLLILDLL